MDRVRDAAEQPEHDHARHRDGGRMPARLQLHVGQLVAPAIQLGEER
jgi:hypothetical protein